MRQRAVAASSFALLLLSTLPALADAAPDLAVRKIDIDGNRASVFVSNTGDTESGTFKLRVMALTADHKTLQKIDVDVPSIAAHQFSRVDVDIDTAGADQLTAIADSHQMVTESNERNNLKSAAVPVKIAPEAGATGGAQNKIVIPPPAAAPAGDIAVQQIKFGTNKGKDTVTVVVRNVGEQAWKEGKRELILTRVAMLPSGPVKTTVGKLAALPPLAPGQSFARLFPRPAKVAGATSYTWEATLAPGDSNGANDHLSKSTSVTKLDDND
jgi:hypothetical protein